MSDLYQTDSKLSGVFKGASFSISVGSVSSTLVGALVQSLAINYSRDITRVYELGDNNVFFIQGHTQGQGQLQQIVGPQGIVSAMVNSLADICSASGQTLSLSAVSEQCSGNSGLTITLTAPVATNVGLTANAGNFVIDQSLAFAFASMSQS